MSSVVQTKRVTVPEIRGPQGQASRWWCLTCYHAHTARLLDDHVDLMLVGDSLGMVMHGLESTLGVTLDMMITARQGGDARLEATPWWSSTCRSAPMRRAPRSPSATPCR